MQARAKEREHDERAEQDGEMDAPSGHPLHYRPARQARALKEKHVRNHDDGEDIEDPHPFPPARKHAGDANGGHQAYQKGIKSAEHGEGDGLMLKG
ncbi:hypothetical protein AA0616_1560 [Komagataeibacter nataicola NRIC 0616]|nr:hypothetical protein AA0616_1560 [Komagataeibacter nataicola NRIC 0616]